MKTLVIKSESKDEDMKAAFTIMEECNKDPNLKKIVWYSNIAQLVGVLENRFDEVDAVLKKREVDFAKATQAAIKATDRVRNAEIECHNLKQAVNEIESWMKAQIKVDKKKEKPNKDKKEKETADEV